MRPDNERRLIMLRLMKVQEFVQNLFDQPDIARKAALIIEAILEARSPRLSDLSHKLPASPDAKYKMLQRFLARVDPREALQRLFDGQAAFVLGDPTEIERPQARATPYVGRISDGKTRGFWTLLLATPFRGRALPFAFVCYSSRTLETEASSRNLEHRRCLRQVKELIGDKILVLDREFSYEVLMQALVEEEIAFVIRLNLGRHQPILLDDEDRRVKLHVTRRKQVSYRGLRYKGNVRVNVAGVWRKGLREPLWVITNLDPKEALSIYRQRMKIEESFKDLKSLLCIDKIMNKKQENMEKMLAMVMIAYTIRLMVGEALRDRLYAPPVHPQKGSRATPSRKWRCYSGLFVLLKHKIRLAKNEIRSLVAKVLCSFKLLVLDYVRT
jgi:hypothetical protein